MQIFKSPAVTHVSGYLLWRQKTTNIGDNSSIKQKMAKSFVVHTYRHLRTFKDLKYLPVALFKAIAKHRLWCGDLDRYGKNQVKTVTACWVLTVANKTRHYIFKFREILSKANYAQLFGVIIFEPLHSSPLTHLWISFNGRKGESIHSMFA